MNGKFSIFLVKYDVGDVVVNARRFYTFVGGEQFKVKNIFLHNLFNVSLVHF